MSLKTGRKAAPEHGHDSPPAPAAGGERLEQWLFVFGLLVYAATRLYRLPDFPIFFFTDEAIQANTAHAFVLNHFRDKFGTFLPPYFLNDQRWAMSLNIYLLALPVVLLGKTVVVTRGLFAVVSLLGAAAAGGALRLAGSRAWWSAPLLFAAMPVDFLHSRVAFETTPAFFAGFVFAYLLYRLRSPNYAALAILLGGATFYSYTAGQGIMLVMGVLLLLVDIRYHVRVFRARPRLFAGSILLLLLVILPFAREQRRHPTSTHDQLVLLNSYWIRPGPLQEKLAIYGKKYVTAFRPAYWFRENTLENVRHLMKGMAYVPPVYVPLILLGIGSAIVKWRRSPGHRVILLSPLAVPLSVAAGDLQVLRVLPMIVPIALLSGLGAGQALSWIPRLLRRFVSVAGAAALTVVSIALAREALVHGPTWYKNYGLYGMQYGASQIFREIRKALARSPSTRAHVPSTWANNPDPFLDFFLRGTERKRGEIGDVESYLLYHLPVSGNDLFVMTADQYQLASTSRKLILEAPEATVAWPDGRTGFYFVRMKYAENADVLFAAEREARRKLVEDTVFLGGEQVVVRHSMLDIGALTSLFDNDLNTLVRGMEANPFVVEVLFPKPRRIAGVRMKLGAMDIVKLKVIVTPDAGDARTYEKTYPDFRADPSIDFALPDGPVRASQVRVEIEEVHSGETAHVHVLELSFP